MNSAPICFVCAACREQGPCEGCPMLALDDALKGETA